MTKKQTKSGTRSKLWCCFGGSNDHPDIQIDTTITERLMTPPKVEATMQMPPITEWQSKFEELVVSEINLSSLGLCVNATISVRLTSIFNSSLYLVKVDLSFMLSVKLTIIFFALQGTSRID